MPSGLPLIQVQPPTKAWWRSKTLWFNLVCLGMAAAESQLNVLQGVLPGGLYAWLAFIMPIGNAALRAVTTAGLFVPSGTPATSAPATPGDQSNAGFTTVGLVMVIALMSAAAWVVFDAGRHVERSTWLQRQASADAAAKKKADADRQVADQSIGQAQADAAGWRDVAAQLDSELHDARHVPLVTAARCNPPAQPGDAGAVGGALGAAAQAPHPGDRGGGVSLSAVRLWNSALAGQQLPAAACRPDDPTSAACAAEAGVTFEQLWANHVENATRCRIDRGNHERLIEYLEQRQRNMNGGTP